MVVYFDGVVEKKKLFEQEASELTATISSPDSS